MKIKNYTAHYFIFCIDDVCQNLAGPHTAEKLGGNNHLLSMNGRKCFVFFTSATAAFATRPYKVYV